MTISKNGASTFTTSSKAVGGYVPLGMEGDKCVIFSELHRSVFRLGAKDFDQMSLASKLGVDWLEENYSEYDPKSGRTTINVRRLAMEITRDCQKIGPFTNLRQRGAGVWLDADNQLIINGKSLWKPDGTVIQHGIHGDKVYPLDGDVGFDINTEEATDEEVAQVLLAFSSLQWANPLGGEILLGWYAASVLPAALQRRPHVLITGKAGSGKSTVLSYMRWLHGASAHACTGNQTLAALCQAIGARSKAVIVDEFEADVARRGTKAVLDVARMSYSLGEDDAGITRGTVSGEVRTYPVRSPFIAAGISPGSMEKADLTRWVCLELKGAPTGSDRLTESEATKLAPKLKRRIVNRWNVLQDSLVVFRQAITQSGGTERMADTIGTLLACYWAITSNAVVSAEVATQMLETYGLGEKIEDDKEADENQCLEVLLHRVLQFTVMQDDVEVRKQLSIGQAMKLVAQQPGTQLEIAGRLAQLGLRVALWKGKWTVFVACSHAHPELSKLYKGTRWATGGWSIMLRRLPGGQQSTQRLGAGYPVTKVVAFDLPAHLCPADELDMELPLAA